MDTDVEVDSGAKVLREARAEFLVISRWVLSGIIETFFIACLLVTQWLLEKYGTSQFQAKGVTEFILRFAEVMFAIALMVPITMYTIQTVVTVILRTYRGIQKEIER